MHHRKQPSLSLDIYKLQKKATERHVRHITLSVSVAGMLCPPTLPPPKVGVLDVGVFVVGDCPVWVWMILLGAWVCICVEFR